MSSALRGWCTPWLFAAAALAQSVGCGTAARAPSAWGDRVAAAARWHLDELPHLGRQDCSGLVTAVLARAGHSVAGNTRTFWQDADAEGRIGDEARVGDLVFFDRTWDSNRNGRVDDNLTHIAVVVRIEPDNTVVMVHFGSGRIRTLRMNLAHRHNHKVDGVLKNDYLRSPRYGRGKAGPRLAGELFRGYARPPGP